MKRMVVPTPTLLDGELLVRNIGQQQVITIDRSEAIEAWIGWQERQSIDTRIRRYRLELKEECH